MNIWYNHHSYIYICTHYMHNFIGWFVEIAPVEHIKVVLILRFRKLHRRNFSHPMGGAISLVDGIGMGLSWWVCCWTLGNPRETEGKWSFLSIWVWNGGFAKKYGHLNRENYENLGYARFWGGFWSGCMFGNSLRTVPVVWNIARQEIHTVYI